MADEIEVDIDIDEQEAQLREAAGKYTTVRFRGEVLEFPPPKLWPPSAYRALEDNDVIGWMEIVLGDDQYEKVSDPEPTLHVVEPILEGIMKKSGIDPKKQLRSSQRSGKKRSR